MIEPVLEIEVIPERAPALIFRPLMVPEVAAVMVEASVKAPAGVIAPVPEEKKMILPFVALVDELRVRVLPEEAPPLIVVLPPRVTVVAVELITPPPGLIAILVEPPEEKVPVPVEEMVKAPESVMVLAVKVSVPSTVPAAKLPVTEFEIL